LRPLRLTLAARGTERFRSFAQTHVIFAAKEDRKATQLLQSFPLLYLKRKEESPSIVVLEVFSVLGFDLSLEEQFAAASLQLYKVFFHRVI
jgi:hypothetical protein